MVEKLECMRMQRMHIAAHEINRGYSKNSPTSESESVFPPRPLEFFFSVILRRARWRMLNDSSLTYTYVRVS